MNSEQISNLIKNRRSTYPKQFSGEKIDKESITQLLELANWAPNHKLTEPWRFIVFEGQTLQELIDLHKSIYLNKTPKDQIISAKLEKFEIVKANTSHLIAIVCELDEAKRLPEWEEIAATAMAVQNMYLALDAFDICGYWSTGNTNTLEMRKLLEVKENQVHLGWFYLGKPNRSLPQGRRIRKPVEYKITWK